MASRARLRSRIRGVAEAGADSAPGFGSNGKTLVNVVDKFC